ncbi:3'-5' exonuclease [Paramagnetospirillum magneticum]|uniref:DNA-directed DNA polymerase n=1 Tax=Paramagnetospirillum magneticum (strain ATCC 700264 / AMB-1) TaxID=342108 RepID=Q2W5M2_PARM1|nr:exonuclease domain-containing protein [Paramagnetospirillum magneticum]BAE50853.1 DNA polymerase III, epsilon subunit and related 3'-5' exonuclease [Paramagnetospirillum magneticum AMB-1]
MMLTLDDLSEVGRLIAIDAETTGFRVPTAAEIKKMPKGLRLPGVMIEIGCVELLRGEDGWKTGESWHRRIQPGGPIAKASIAVHGITPAELKDAPQFRDVLDEFETFIGQDMLLAHSAENEIEFLNFEYARVGRCGFDDVIFSDNDFVCTQELSRQFFPGVPGSLDVLCDRLWIDRSDRFEHHGALLDAILTAEAFMKMAGGFVQDDTRYMSFGDQ